jgi:ectoine hydroxylase-related dioxygenase (phytanoyl-CoA dioxygenase family)
MLTTAQTGYFTTFGFVVLRGFLADCTAALRAEVDAAIRGALRLVPGSHHPEQGARLAAYQRRRPPVLDDADADAYRVSVPGYVADTSPGDVIAFDLHTWHASFGGRDRLAWTAVYQRCPETSEERDRTLRSVHDSFEQAFRSFDRDRYPVWRDWLDGAAAHPRRDGVIGRMRQAGVLDLPGARDGW